MKTARATLSLPTRTLRELDRYADAERRTRSSAAAVLLERLLFSERAAPTHAVPIDPNPGRSAEGV